MCASLLCSPRQHFHLLPILLSSMIYVSKTLSPASKTVFSWLHRFALTQFLPRWWGCLGEYNAKLHTFATRHYLRAVYVEKQVCKKNSACTSRASGTSKRVEKNRVVICYSDLLSDNLLRCTIAHTDDVDTTLCVLQTETTDGVDVLCACCTIISVDDRC